MTSKTKTKSVFMVFFRIILCGGILILGAWGMRTLAGMKKAPAEIKTSEQTLKVEVGYKGEEKPQLVLDVVDDGRNPGGIGIGRSQGMSDITMYFPGSSKNSSAYVLSSVSFISMSSNLEAAGFMLAIFP